MVSKWPIAWSLTARDRHSWPVRGQLRNPRANAARKCSPGRSGSVASRQETVDRQFPVTRDRSFDGSGASVAVRRSGAGTAGAAGQFDLITPLVQQNRVRLPPVVTIMAVVLAAALFGARARVVATPLAVVVMVTVKMLSVEDVLGEQRDVPGEHRAAETA